MCLCLCITGGVPIHSQGVNADLSRCPKSRGRRQNSSQPGLGGQCESHHHGQGGDCQRMTDKCCDAVAFCQCDCKAGHGCSWQHVQKGERQHEDESQREGYESDQTVREFRSSKQIVAGFQEFL